MIKFEEHEGELFRMLEEPVPLTDDAELPVLVRLIQDDTMLGKANKRINRPDTLAQKIICSNLTDGGLYLGGNYAYRYEIIGTLVEEGSKEWALYQMMQGKIEDAIADVCPSTDEYRIELCNLNHIPESPKQDDVEKPSVPNPDVSNTTYTICPKCGGTGYEIEEPCDAPNPESATQTPLPVSDATQYKVGDWVEVEETTTGEIEHHIVERINTFCPVSPEYLVDDMWFNHDGMEIIPLDWTFSRKRITRQLDPSEVIVHIGCLSGTIAKSCDPNYFLMLHSRPITDCNHSMIRFSAIDKETRSLVESLLKAQKEVQE